MFKKSAGKAVWFEIPSQTANWNEEALGKLLIQRGAEMLSYTALLLERKIATEVSCVNQFSFV